MTEASRVLFTAGEAAGMLGGACRGNLNAPIRTVVVDSRRAEEDSLFVALQGEKADGHDFIVEALRGGASCVLAASAKKDKVYKSLAAKGVELKKGCIIFSESPLAGLQALAREQRKRMKTLLRVGVTGSSGKTTTKECMAAALKSSYPEGAVAVNEGNLNSDIGLSLSMFTLSAAHRVGVFEMGVNRKGEMDELAAIYEPDIAFITNIGRAHIGILGSEKGIAKEKKKIFSRFDGKQRGFVWEDDPHKEFLKAEVAGSIAEFGPRSTEGIEAIENLGLAGWRLVWRGCPFVFPLPGTHNLLNALAALSLAAELRLDPEKTGAGLASVRALFGRSEIFVGRVSLLRDCYNANPESMAAAMDFCDGLAWQGRKVYVLGSMLELGSVSTEAHAAMGERAAASRAEGLFFFGEDARSSYEAALAARNAAPGRPAGSIFHTCDIESLKQALFAYLRDGDLVLAKASRGLALERLTESLFETGWVQKKNAASAPGCARAAAAKRG